MLFIMRYHISRSKFISWSP